MPLTTSPTGSTGTIDVSSQIIKGVVLLYGCRGRAYPPGGSWFEILAGRDASGALNLTVSLNTAGLANGSYQGRIDFIDTGNIVETSLVVTLDFSGATLIATPPSLAISATVNSTIQNQTINLTSSSPTIPIVLQSFPMTASHG